MLNGTIRDRLSCNDANELTTLTGAVSGSEIVDALAVLSDLREDK